MGCCPRYAKQVRYRVMFTTRAVLLAGFGGLLALMAFAGFGAVRILRQIEQRNEAIRRDFLERSRVLQQIRSDLYLSGTYLRDYLLDPDPLLAERHRASLERTRMSMEEALTKYQRFLPGLRVQLDEYWRVLDPVFRWSAQQRAARGYLFLRDQVFPRRTNMLGIANQIAAINEQQLNGGNRQVGELFSQFRTRLGATLAITLSLGFLLAAFSMARILRLERESAIARQELKDLSARLVEAQENERRAISRELHDEVGQALSALLVELGNLSAALVSGSGTALRGHVETIKKLAEDSVGVVRNMALLLRPSMLDDFGLVPALQWQAREVSKRTGMDVNVATDNVSDDLPDEHKTCVYRVVQEALHNCSKHAQASVVRVTVKQASGRILLSVQDNGKGFEPRHERGLGLLGMEERVSYLGGEFSVESSPGHGTLLHIVLPIDQRT